jgi:peptide/nickel transport system substrate-binding protein
MYRSGASRNYGGVENAPGLDALLDNMISEFDEAKRKSIIQQVAAKIHDNGERIIPYFHNYFCANSDKLRGFTPPKYDIVEMRHMWLS